MLDTFLDALTGRRLGGALLVLGGVVVAAIVLWPHGGAGKHARAERVQPARIVSVPQLGLAFAYPSTWSRSVSGRVIRLRGPRGALLTFATPVEGRHTEQVSAQTKAALARSFAPATVVHEGTARLGARPARSFELDGFGSEDPVRVLALVAGSDYRTYVVTLITPSRPSAKEVAQARQTLATVRLTKPESVRAEQPLTSNG